MTRRSLAAATAFLAPPGLWIGLLFVLPMATIVLLSFWRVVDYDIVADFTLANYQKLFRPLYLDVFWRTIKVSLLVTAISLLIGYPVAYYLARKTRRFRVTLLVLVILPLWTSYLVRTYAWMLILGTKGAVNQALQAVGLTSEPISWLLYSDFAVTLALVHIYVPYLILPLYSVLEKLDPSLFEAAKDLGGGRWRTFWHVTLPLSLPGVATGCLFVFIPSMGSFVTPELLGGTRSILIGSIVAQQFGVAFEYPLGSAMALAIMGIILLAAVALLRAGRPAGVA
ncbi:ABC transporter permease [Reyranella sp.]|uniref:ABC transporter permease n=1 Tax=Reyranella sp. TaxID=1929291 RepID=UPI003784F280